MKKIFTLCVLQLITGLALAQPGSLDSTFSSDGKLIVPVGSADDYGKSIGVQSDGKVLVAGYSSTGSGYDFSLLRFNSDGTADNSFGSSGVAITDFGGSTDRGEALLIQADGKIVVVGKGMSTFTDDPAAYDFALVRYNANGTLDNTFGTGGKVLTDLDSASSDYGYAAALQSDGKILVTGSRDIASAIDFTLVRYNTDGTLDPGFGSGGKVFVDYGGTRDIAYSVKVQSDGKIVIAGLSSNSGTYDFALARFNSDGSPDNSFDGDGKLLADLGGMYDYATSISVQSDGKIVAAGQSHNGVDYDFAIARFNSNGTLDNTFDADGKLNISFGTGTSEGIASVLVQPDGKILVGGHSSGGSAGGDDFALMRFNADGSLDNSFDGDGKVLTDFGGTLNSEYINSIALQPDGKIVAVGDKGQNFSSTSFVWDIAIARYNVAALSAGVTEADPGMEPEVYPNPSSGIFQIAGNYTGSVKMEIYNSIGEKIKEATGRQFDLSAEQAGIYFVKMVCGDKVVVRKIVLGR